MRYVFALNDKPGGGSGRGFSIPETGVVYVVKDVDGNAVDEFRSPASVAVGDIICTHGAPGCSDGVVQDPITTV